MLACTETVTLVHPIRGDDGDTYICTVIQGASWYQKAAISVGGDGAGPFPTCKARIPAEHMPDGIAPEEGDYLVRGALDTVNRAPADLADREYALITTVGDNCRGRFPHWLLQGGAER